MSDGKKRTNEILLTMLSHAKDNDRTQLDEYIMSLTQNDFQLLKDFAVNLIECCAIANNIFEKHNANQEVGE